MLVDSAVPTTGIAPSTSLASSSSPSPFHLQQQAGSSRRMGGGNGGDSRSSATPGEDRERLIGRDR
jgi:hypothetical protein